MPEKGTNIFNKDTRWCKWGPATEDLGFGRQSSLSIYDVFRWKQG